jgi:hypothetical protein
MKAAPIYLLRDDKVAGPYDYDGIFTMLQEGEIEDETLSRIEGMTNWRSIPETRIWSEAKVLSAVLEEAKSIASRIGAQKLDLRYGRVELKKVLTSKNILICDIDSLGVVLKVNGWLEVKCSKYNSSQAASDFFPAQELSAMGSQNFSRDWPSVWQKAGGKIYNEKMIARSDDPVWLAISDFGYPVPPFSFDEAIWVRDVSIDDAEKLGVPDLNRPIKLPKISPFKFVGLEPK